MSNPIFIDLGHKRLVNLAHVISADFWPAEPGGEDDGEGNVSAPAPARLVLTTTELRAREFGYDGNYDAAASESVYITVRGDYAETAWASLQAFALARAA